MKYWRLDTHCQTLVLASNGSLPFVCYWNEALPMDEDMEALCASHRHDITGGMLDVLPPLSLSPQSSTNFQGQLGLALRTISGNAMHPEFVLANVKERKTDDGATLHIICADLTLGLTISFDLSVHVKTNMLVLQSQINCDDTIMVDWLAAPVLPAPQYSNHCVEVSGRWCGEFQLNNVPWSAGARLRESVSGRTGHEDFPGLIIPQTSTSNDQGGCFGFHYGWSGGHRMVIEELADGRRQVQFGHATDRTNTPINERKTAKLYATFSPDGINGIARAFQSHLRADILPFSASSAPRLVHYNCWEAVYFDHKLDELKEIASRAHDLGAERFVLDDGWFGLRDDDTSSLGDWDIDPRKYPDGLTPLIDHIKSLGMEFGLWFEPEMVSPNSELYRAHPDWILGRADQILGRYQMVLDLSNPDVIEYLFGKISGILASHDITYIKWDHNRVLPYPDSRQTEQLYGLFDRLRTAHPQVDIESCSSGGGRIDYGILARSHRVWLSDSNDAIERFKMQNNAAIWLPAEITGSHVGPRECHTSGRILPMEFRAYVAASRHMGFEMDPRELTNAEAAILKDVTDWYKLNRNWMHQGAILRLSMPDPSLCGELILSSEAEQFVALIGQITPSDQVLPRPVCLTGLEPSAHYEISLRNPQSAASQSRGPVALRNGPLRLSGAALMGQGIMLPAAFPATMWVIEGQKVS